MYVWSMNGMNEISWTSISGTNEIEHVFLQQYVGHDPGTWTAHQLVWLWRLSTVTRSCPSFSTKTWFELQGLVTVQIKQHLTKKVIYFIYTISRKYLKVMSKLPNSKLPNYWDIDQPLCTTEWTFKKSYLMMSSKPRNGAVLGVTKNTPTACLQHLLPNPMLPEQTTKWHVIKLKSKLLPEHTPDIPWHWASIVLSSNQWNQHLSTLLPDFQWLNLEWNDTLKVVI